LIESPSEEEEEEEEEDSEREYDEDEMALFIKKFNKFIKKRRLREKGKRSQGQRECTTITVKMGTSLPNAHMRGRKKTMTR
jgi:hypothetical protein